VYLRDERCLWNAQLFLFNNHELPRRVPGHQHRVRGSRGAGGGARPPSRCELAGFRRRAGALRNGRSPAVDSCARHHALAETGRALSTEAAGIEASAPSEAASRTFRPVCSMASRACGGVGARPFRGISGGAQSGGRTHACLVRANGNQACGTSLLPDGIGSGADRFWRRVVRHSAVLPGLGRHGIQYGHYSERHLPHSHHRPPAE